jgi:two-component system, NarL family, nitrate/nitrite response regulator NarL
VETITVYLIDRHQQYRSFLISCFNEYYPEIRIAGSSSDLQEALSELENLQPDIVIADISELGIPGESPVQSIKEHCPDAKVIVITISENEDLFFNAIAAGALGYLLKEASLRDIIGCIQQAMKGKMTVPRRLAIKLLGLSYLLETIHKNSLSDSVKN